LQTHVDDDVAESEEDEHKVVLRHHEGLLHEAVQWAFLNEEGEDKVKHVVANKGNDDPENQPEGILKGGD
jgi:Icc-related predicted phosphoesterase